MSKTKTALTVPKEEDRNDEDENGKIIPAPIQSQPIKEYDSTDALPVEKMIAQVESIQLLMQRLMKKDIHYGVIPGTGKKPSLLKPGAEKLMVMFRLFPRYVVLTQELPDGHAEFRLTANLHSISTGQLVGSGVGSCSTMEKKYRWRKGTRICPECGEAAIIKGKDEYGGGWLCWKKNDPAGCGFKWPDGAEEIESQETEKKENEDIADVRNTCLKMAKKRALIDAILSATAASDIFTQDIEDMDIGTKKGNGNGGSGKVKSIENAPKKKEDPKDKAMTEFIAKMKSMPQSLRELFEELKQGVSSQNRICAFFNCEWAAALTSIQWLQGVFSNDQELAPACKILGLKFPDLVELAEKYQYKNSEFIWHIINGAKKKAKGSAKNAGPKEGSNG